jgi:hypothetical protein
MLLKNNVITEVITKDKFSLYGTNTDHTILTVVYTGYTLGSTCTKLKESSYPNYVIKERNKNINFYLKITI